MIDIHFGEFVLFCDYCGEEVEESFELFDEALEYKKENGWKSFKTSKGWKDCCPDCIEY